jgi:hypothetical protein
VTPLAITAGDHHVQDAGFMVEVKGGTFQPISGWLSIKGGKLSEVRFKE